MQKSFPRHLRLILHGKAAARPEVRKAVKQVRNEGHRVEVRVTWEGGDAVRLAKEAAADGVDTVVACGGDGTLNEVVAGVVDGSGPPRSAVGLMPLGTANDFAHGTGIPVQDLTVALRLAAETEPRPADLGTISGRIFVNMATGGFGSRVTVETPPELKKTFGKLSYLLTGVSRFNAFGAAESRLSGPGYEWSGPLVALAVGNGRQAGGGIQLCPNAVLDDGLLDVTVLPEIPKTERLDALKALLREGLPAVERVAVQQRLPWLEVEVPAGLYVNLDGEPVHDTHFRFEVRKQWLRLHLPAGDSP